MSESKTISGTNFSTSWGYNSADQPVTLTYPGGEVVTMAYNGQILPDQLSSTLGGLVNAGTWYDGSGRLDKLTLANGIVIDPGYYSWTAGSMAGRLHTQSAGTYQNLNYSYDAVGNISNVSDVIPTAGSQTQTQAYTYDPLNRLSTAAVTGNPQSATYNDQYSYSAASGNIDQKGPAGQEGVYSYDPNHPHGVTRVTSSGGSTKTITVRAAGTPAGGVWPTMTLKVNGNLVATWSVSQYGDYTTSAVLSGNDVFDLSFTNDAVINGEDRNLVLYFMVVDGQTIQVLGGAALIYFEPPIGTNVIPAQEWLYWNATLRFVKGPKAFAGAYDANGNMTYRVVEGAAWIYSYDAENHLTQVVSGGGAVAATFLYDGDGQRVMGTVNGITTRYVGTYFETSGTAVKKYYYFGGQRIAERVNGTGTEDGLYYILSDHLGSTNLMVKDGMPPCELRYKAFGETRYSSCLTPPTNFQYTGQRNENALGIYFFNSRWYDTYLNRWIQPDPIIQDPYNPQDWDRFAYVRNNPVNFNDPSGLDVGCPASNPACLGISGYGGSQEYKNYLAEVEKYKVQVKFLQGPNTFAPVGIPSLDSYIPGLPPRQQIEPGKCVLQAFSPTLSNNSRAIPQIEKGPEDQITGLGIGINVSAGSPGTNSNWSGGEEIIVYPGQKNVTSYNYLGPGWSAGGGGGNGSIYLVAVLNANMKEDYTSFTNSTSVTVSVLQYGVTGSYSWSGNSPFEPGSVQSWTVGYAPGARISISGSNPLYWINGSMNLP